MTPAYIVSGFVVGAIVGVTGVGGGSLMTPLLVMLFGVHPATAVGTDLLYAAITKLGGTGVHARKGHVDWKITARLAAGSIPASIITLCALAYFGVKDDHLSLIISTVLGVALLLTAIALFFKQKIQAVALSHSNDHWRIRWIAPITVLTGALLGVLVSLSSVGAGAIGVAVLFFLYPQLPAIRIVGSDLAHAVPLTLVAGVGHWMMGSVDWSLLGSLLIGSLPGIYLGSHLAARMPERLLRPVLASMLVLIGVKLLV